MSLSLILQVIVALLKFPSELRSFILFLEKAPEEKRQEMQDKINKENQNFANTGIPPKWD